VTEVICFLSFRWLSFCLLLFAFAFQNRALSMVTGDERPKYFPGASTNRDASSGAAPTATTVREPMQRESS
jgi:hypothetical protein